MAGQGTGVYCSRYKYLDIDIHVDRYRYQCLDLDICIWCSPPGLGAGVVAQLDGVPLLAAPRQLVAADTVKTTSPIPAHHPTHLNTLVARSAISRQWKHCSLQHSTYLPLSKHYVLSVCPVYLLFLRMKDWLVLASPWSRSSCSTQVP